MNHLVSAILVIFTSVLAVSQVPVCGISNDMLKQSLNNKGFNPSQSKASQRSQAIQYDIPVVVHIFHDNDALGTQFNPTDATIEAIIMEAAQRFRHSHPGAGSYSNPYYGVDTEINLCLAKRDPAGNPTTGIVRHNNPQLATGNGLDLITDFVPHMWNREYYCNLIVMRDLQDASGWYISYLDATIYDSGAFWSGLIAHEVGHYFSLLHTFDSGNCDNDDCDVDGDQICDTPAKSGAGFNGATSCSSPNNQCTTDEDDTSSDNPYRSTALGGLGEQPDMLANYLDYTGPCWDSFTEGQKTRMRSFIETYRSKMINNSSACMENPTELLVTQCYEPAAGANNQAIITTIHFENENIPVALTGPIEMSVYVYGYVPFSSSTYEVFDESGSLLGETDYFMLGNCGDTPMFSTMLSPSEYNTWLADANLEFVFNPTSTFFPFGCSETKICIQFKVVTQGCTGDYSGMSSLSGVISTNQAYLSSNIIESSQIVQGGTTHVVYQSALGVELFTPFEVSAGNTFIAQIDGCE